jgi:elongation factor 1 alpha-like protein
MTTTARSESDIQLDNIALAGDTVELSLANIDSARLSPGCVICHSNPSLRPKVERKFEARISVMERLAVPIIRGSACLLHMHSLDVPAVLTKLM